MLASQIPTDEMFDLDAVLTMAAVDETDNHEEREENDESEAKAKAKVKAACRLLDQLPTVEGGGGQCAVCSEGLRLSGAAKRIPCGHVFHQDCILRWLSLIYSCPLCRQICPPPGTSSSD